MTIEAPARVGSAGAATLPKLVAVMPAYNEAATILGVLADLYPRVDRVVVVDDGSTDGTGVLIDDWVASHPRGTAIHLPSNQGYSAALRAGWQAVRALHDAGDLDADDVAITIDADGQHDPAVVEALAQHLIKQNYAAVIGRRDLSYHGPFKRLGNAVMSVVGSLFGGMRFDDIESGYRVVRLGALLDAQRYYRGRRYSSSVEMAVLLARLGYRIDNTFPVAVPVGRSRTRLRDALYHVIAMLLAVYRLACWRNVPPAQRSLVSAVAAAAVIVAFAVFLGAMLTHAFYLGNDSAQSYGHVWFIERALWSGEGLPLRMPSLEAGRAFTFPYGLLPWLPAALVRPILGDWAVTASIALGALLLVVGIWRWLPRTRSPLLTALLLLNPQLLGGLAQFQLPTFWALAFACFSAAEFTRTRPVRGTAFAVAALFAHPLVGAAALCCTALVNADTERRLPRTQIAGLAVAALLASPAIWMFTHTPLVAETGFTALIAPVALTLKRVSIIGWAWAVSRFAPAVLRWWQPLVVVAVLVIANDFRHAPPVGLWERSQPRFSDFIAAGRVAPDATYRVLTTTNHEDGMVQLMQAGAHLGQEFFDESIQRRSFGTTEAYRCFLAQKRVSHVLVSAEYRALQWPDEVPLLDRLVEHGLAARTFQGSAGTVEYTLRAVDPPPTCPPQVR